CRSSHSFEEAERPLPDLRVTLSRRLLGVAFIWIVRLGTPLLRAGAPRPALPRAVLAHHLHQHAFAQAAVGDPYSLAGKGAAVRAENRATGENEAGTLGPSPGIAAPIFIAPTQQPRDPPRHFIVGHPAAIDTAALVTSEFEMDAGDGGYRSRGAEQVDVIAFKSAMLGHETVDEGGDLSNHCGVDFARDLMSAVALCER